MILHCVFCVFRNTVADKDQKQILRDLSAFCETFEGVIDFEYGPNRDFEQKSQAFQAGFVIRFTDRAALEAYAVHPTHQRLGERLSDLCEGGGDGIIVFDIESDLSQQQ